MTTVWDRICEVYAPTRDRPPFGHVAQGVLANLILVIGGVDVASQLEGRIGPSTPLGEAVVFWEATSMISAMATVWLIWPWLRDVHRRIPPSTKRWAALAAIGAAAAGTHIAGFKLLRVGGAAVLGPAFACPLLAKLPYEFAKDLTFLVGFVGGLFLAPESLRRAIFDPAPTPRGPILVQSTPDLLDLPDGRSRQRLRSSDIVAVSSAGNYAEFRLIDGRRPLLRATLTRLETQLATQGLLRVHRSWIINPTHVRRIQTQPSGDFQLTLLGGEVIPASRRYGDAVAGVIGAAQPLGAASEAR